MTDEDRAVSRRTLDQALYFGGYTDTWPPSDDDVRVALIKALLPIVGGADGLMAALEVLRGARDAAPSV